VRERIKWAERVRELYNERERENAMVVGREGRVRAGKDDRERR
jgi:hypothetical protein